MRFGGWDFEWRFDPGYTRRDPIVGYDIGPRGQPDTNPQEMTDRAISGMVSDSARNRWGFDMRRCNSITLGVDPSIEHGKDPRQRILREREPKGKKTEGPGQRPHFLF